VIELIPFLTTKFLRNQVTDGAVYDDTAKILFPTFLLQLSSDFLRASASALNENIDDDTNNASKSSAAASTGTDTETVKKISISSPVSGSALSGGSANTSKGMSGFANIAIQKYSKSLMVSFGQFLQEVSFSLQKFKSQTTSTKLKIKAKLLHINKKLQSGFEGDKTARGSAILSEIKVIDCTLKKLNL